MRSTQKWIAALSLGAAALAGPVAADARGCDAMALACPGAAAAARGASFLDLVRSGDALAGDSATPREPLPHPAVYSQAEASHATPAMAPAGVGALDSAMGTQLPGEGVPAWLALPRSLAAPDSSVAWVFALGFLGFVILRRVRSAPDY
ncbi:MAG TPA: hypothetical protein VLS49_11425 [Usitatibacter sp.]|nr:hypothetical protein [Usitatibacter sp.]